MTSSIMLCVCKCECVRERVGGSHILGTGGVASELFHFFVKVLVDAEEKTQLATEEPGEESGEERQWNEKDEGGERHVPLHGAHHGDDEANRVPGQAN